MTKILPLAASRGLVVDNVVCGDDLAEGRPSPLMMYRSFADLGVHPAKAVLKVDDTLPGIAEARAAGSPSVDITLSGNAVRLGEAALSQFSESEKDALHGTHAARFREAGADYVLRSVADLPQLIKRLAPEI